MFCPAPTCEAIKIRKVIEHESLREKEHNILSFLLGHFQQVQISCKREQFKRTFLCAVRSANSGGVLFGMGDHAERMKFGLKKRWWMSSQQSEKDG